MRTRYLSFLPATLKPSSRHQRGTSGAGIKPIDASLYTETLAVAVGTISGRAEPTMAARIWSGVAAGL